MIEILGHRAFKAKYPENTLLSYDKAYEAGVNIIETDVQMTKDGIVVMNHDNTTGRMYNKNLVINDTNWQDLRKLYCKNVPGEHIPTLVDALKWTMEHSSVKLLIDIKPTNEKIILIKIMSDMLKVYNNLKFWQEKIIFGLWRLDWYEFGIETNVLKDFKFVAISFSSDMSLKFIEYSKELNNPHYKLHGVSLYFISTWTNEFRMKILPYLQEHNLHIYVWTVNHDIDFKYLVSLPINGIISDDPIQAIKSKNKWITSDHKFIKPPINSSEGLRFYGCLTIYRIVVLLLFSPWSNVKLIGNWTIARIVYMFLKLSNFG